MMNEQDEILIWKFIDGELPEGEYRRFKQRMNTDRTFREAVTKARSLDQDLSKHISWERPPTGLVQQVMTKVRKDTSPSLSHELDAQNHWIRWYLAACAVVATVAVSIIITSDQQPLSSALPTFSWMQSLKWISSPIAQMTSMVSLSLFFLFLIDSWLLKRNQGKFVSPV